MAELTDRTASLWMDTTADAPGFEALDRDLDVDVAVVGGGILGLTVALLCAREGASVAVLERDVVGGGVTGHTTGKVTALHGTAYSELRSRHGVDVARAYAQGNAAAVETIRELVDELGIDCDARPRDAYTYVADLAARPAVEEEAAAAGDAGLRVDLVTATPLPFPVAGAVRLGDQLELNARRYVLGLARAVADTGGLVFEHTAATGVAERRGPAVELAGGRRVSARDIVVATLMPFLDRGLFFSRLTPMRSYCIAVRGATTVPDGMLISADEPTRSMRPALGPGGEELLIVGGEGHPTGEEPDTRERYGALERFAREHFGPVEVTHRWSAHDLQPADGLPYIGHYTPASPHVWTAAGFRKWGMTNATMAAEILATLLAGGEHPLAAPFDTGRLDVTKAASGIAKEVFKDARHFAGDRLAHPDAGSLGALARGEGAVVKVDGELIAAYRDEGGRIIQVSPTCTHLGCRVRWNTAERSWDCPCHGSRFAPDGTILTGPATSPLARRD